MHSLMVAGERLHACGYKGDGRLGLGGPDGRGANIYGVGPEPVAGAFKPQPVDADDLIFGGRRFRQCMCALRLRAVCAALGGAIPRCDWLNARHFVRKK